MRYIKNNASYFTSSVTLSSHLDLLVYPLPFRISLENQAWGELHKAWKVAKNKELKVRIRSNLRINKYRDKNIYVEKVQETVMIFDQLACIPIILILF